MPDESLFDEIFDRAHEMNIRIHFKYFDSFQDVKVFREKYKEQFLKFPPTTKEKKIIEITLIEHIYVAEVLMDSLDVNQIIHSTYSRFVEAKELRLKFI